MLSIECPVPHRIFVVKKHCQYPVHGAAGHTLVSLKDIRHPEMLESVSVMFKYESHLMRF